MTGDQIAVVGIAGRFPEAADPDALWANLCAGVDAVHDYTEAELRAEGIGPGLLADPAHVPAGGRLPGDIAGFDAGFFGFDPADAARTDPQHRLFLEVAWEALEDAGCDPGRAGGEVGVFASTSVNRYFLFHLFDNPAAGGAAVDPDDWEGRITPGQLPDHLPGQVAYRLGLSGPSVAVQCACSSSLVAVCLAAQSLVDLRCDVALAGGVSVTWPRYRHTEGGLVSPDGRCRAFDAGAAGSGFSSGAGAVVLKRLDDALADRDHLYAVVSGWSITNDGPARAGFAVPGVDGLAAAVTEATVAAQVTPSRVGFVEAHGSGTRLGDAIEVTALTRAYRALGGAPREACALGSVKTGIGHLDAAAGIASLIKAVLAVHHGRVPPNLHFDRPSPDLDLPASPFFVPTGPIGWPVDGPRVAAVSASGVGGTNAHLVLDQAPPQPALPAPPDREFVLPLSARSPRALQAVAARLASWLRDGPAPLRLADVAFTLATGRRGFRHRTAVTGTSLAEVVGRLESRANGFGPDHQEASAEGVRGWLAGGAVDWSPWYADLPVRRVRLPTYPFERERHWVDPPGVGRTRRVP